MPRRIEKKLVQPWFDYVASGRKTYDLRLADFDCEPGDILVLREYEPAEQQFTGREIEKVVTYVGKTKGDKTYTQEEVDRYGYQIISFHEKE